jgi:hypothetical protein
MEAVHSVQSNLVQNLNYCHNLSSLWWQVTKTRKKQLRHTTFRETVLITHTKSLLQYMKSILKRRRTLCNGTQCTAKSIQHIHFMLDKHTHIHTPLQFAVIMVN